MFIFMPEKNKFYGIICLLSESCICSFFSFWYGTLPSRLSHACVMNLSPLLIILNVTGGLILSRVLPVEDCKLLLFSFSEFKVEKPAWRKYSLFILNITHCCMAPAPWTGRSWTPGHC